MEFRDLFNKKRGHIINFVVIARFSLTYRKFFAGIFLWADNFGYVLHTISKSRFLFLWHAN